MSDHEHDEQHVILACDNKERCGGWIDTGSETALQARFRARAAGWDLSPDGEGPVRCHACVALARVRAYVDAVPTLYDDENEMPAGLILDSTAQWDGPRLKSQHDLTLADLEAVVRLAEGGAR